MPRRVETVTARDAQRLRLHTEEGRRAYLRKCKPDDHEAWTAAIAPHPLPGHHHLVLDHADPAKPLAELGVHHPGGRPYVHAGGVPRIPCAEPGGCPREAIHGASHCEVHLQPPPDYR